MDQNLSPDADAVTLTKTLCGRLAAARFGDLSPDPGRQWRADKAGGSSDREVART
jgi:hypothetical protein